MIDDGVAVAAPARRSRCARTPCASTPTRPAPEVERAVREALDGVHVPTTVRSRMARHEVLTPIPGTFYRRPDPDSDAVQERGRRGRGGGDDRPGGDHEELPGGASRGRPARWSEYLVDNEDEVDRRPGRRRRRRRRMKRVLVANRGEIAIRVIRAAHDLGLEAVAVHSDGRRGGAARAHGRRGGRDRPGAGGQELPRHRGADRRRRDIGSRRRAPRLRLPGRARGLRRRGARTPACAYVGPKPEHIALMGDKARARAAAEEAGVPTIPGSDGAVGGADEARGGGRRDRLPGRPEGGRRRRRARHPDRRTTPTSSRPSTRPPPARR